VAARRAAAIVAVTPAVRRGYERFGRCETIPPFLPDTEVRAPAPEPSEDVVMVAGLLDLERKGLDLALAAMDRLRQVRSEARLILVGGWVDPARARSLPGYCEATGRLGSDELRAILGAVGCCLIPSLWEEFGYAGLEALAAGTPVACSPLPAYEGLTGGGVFLARSREPQALADELEAALAATSFEFPPECRASVAVPRLVELYEETFGASRTAAG
jgi:glycosyltransferase involved in cell wall biosynthesis